MTPETRAIVKRWAILLSLLTMVLIGTLVYVFLREIFKWQRLHAENVARAKLGGVDILFLGDSHMYAWREAGAQIWKERYEPRAALNFGIPGDNTRQIQWRITDGGEMEGLDPKICVLHVGLNNVVIGEEAPAITPGILKNVETLRQMRPKMKIVLMGIIPRDREPDGPRNVKIKAINAEISKLDDGVNIQYVDIGPKLVDAAGRLPYELIDSNDHMTPAAYKIWADAIDPYLVLPAEAKEPASKAAEGSIP